MMSLQKPKPLAIERHEKRAARTSHEKAEKAKVRKRDGYKCRWPHCDCRKMALRLEVAHLEHKGMGGDKRQVRTLAHKMILIDHLKHQGPRSLDKGQLDIRPLTGAGTNGPCEFYDDGVLVGREIAPGILETIR